jgi:hypothetical protein
MVRVIWLLRARRGMMLSGCDGPNRGSDSSSKRPHRAFLASGTLRRRTRGTSRWWPNIISRAWTEVSACAGMQLLSIGMQCLGCARLEDVALSARCPLERLQRYLRRFRASDFFHQSGENTLGIDGGRRLLQQALHWHWVTEGGKCSVSTQG